MGKEVRAVVRGQMLLVENNQVVPGTGQLSDADRIAPKHPGRHIGGVIAGTENDDLGTRDLAHQTFESLSVETRMKS